EAGALYSKWARDWRDQQLTSGELPNTAPAGGGGGGPAWGSFCILMPWQVYQTYGDKRILDANYSTMKKWLAFLDSKDDANSILQPYYPISGWFFLGDHASPSGNGGTNGVLVFNSCNYLYKTRIMSHIAQVLGKTSESQSYATKADAIKAGINAQFYNATNRNYVDTRQIDYAFPLLTGAVPAADIAAVQTNLQNAITVTKRGHIDAGMLGTTYLIRYLIDVDRSDLIYTMATVSGAPGWADFIQRGFTTWPGETWTSPFTESPIHATYVGIGPWFQQGICGIRSDTAQPGFKQFIIKPAIVGDLTSAAGQIGTMYGSISSDWSKSGTSFTHRIKIPANTIATYFFPDSVIANIKEGSVAAQQAAGVQYLRKESGYSVFQVLSGTYVFTNGAVGVHPASGEKKNHQMKILCKVKGDRWLIHIPLLTPATVSVYDMAGHCIAVKSGGKGKQWVEFAKPSGAAGCYYVRIVAPGITLSRKVVVVR
ncbi:MAG: T9SS type A sorting domain-containing protein, partial [Chitinispirillaceae bacterium]|nr:T9SS type A sorting domain-containing protein [Chitinispirillaceae bacterium]